MAGTDMSSKSSQEWIDEQYRKTADAQKKKLDADYDISQRGLESQRDKVDETYQPLRNEAYVNNALAEKARKENMANMGLSGEGGTSLSLQQRNEGNRLSTLGDISRQQQGYGDEIDMALANLNTTYNASVGSVDADTEAQRIAAQLAQGQFEDNYALSEQQLRISQGGAKVSQVMELYKKKLITKKQLLDTLNYSKSTGFEEYLNHYFG